MRQYHDLLELVLLKGVDTSDRTGTGTRSYVGGGMRFDLSKGFPLVTTKKVFMRGITEELLWFIRGETNIKSLVERDVHIWDEWADDRGELGPVYGKQWRSWATPDGGHVDQLKHVIDRIRTTPDCRRLIVCSWNVGEIGRMALPPCHCLFQFKVLGGKLHCVLYQRSADLFLGVPFNIASYALLTMMVAHVTGYKPGTFTHFFGDVHIYQNHMDQVQLQLTRESRPLPKMEVNPDVRDIEGFSWGDFNLIGYNPHPAIRAEVSV